MNIWQILGIPPTTDIVTIKKAYAERAKEWHPEEHPEEFKRLRNAYQTAVKWAKSGVAIKAGASVEPPPAKQEEPRQASPQQAAPQQEAPRQASPQQAAPQQEAPWQASPQQETPQPEMPQWEERAEAEEPQPQFSYEDVSSFYQKEHAEQFFREFYWIAWNPYLQNRKAVWHYFFFRPDYEDLYGHEEFQQKLLQEICAVPGWHGETLDYFEWWEDLCWEPDRKEQKDVSRMKTGGRQWARKKWRSRFTCFMPEHVVSQELRQEHYSILQILKDRGLDGSLLNVASADAYIKYYTAFAKDNEKWLENQRKFSRRKRFEYWITLGILLVLLTIILILVFVVRPAMNEDKKEKILEHWREEVILQEEQENREQEERRQELEERFENMQEQYRNWVEQ